MNNQEIFQEEQEVQRLAVQNRLLKQYEAPILSTIFAGRSGLTILDIGCNNGSKTTQWFAPDTVSRVIGLEYNAELVQQAQQKYGNDTYSFYPCNAEAENFSNQLESIMQEKGIDSFDVIYLSFVLMHLKHPDKLLKALRRFLAPNGQLMIVEVNDQASALSPCGQSLLDGFLDILIQDPYSGSRAIGSHLIPLLEACGYTQVIRWRESITAAANDAAQKEDIFTTFFSYLPEDVTILREESPDNPTYQTWEHWLKHHFMDLKHTVLAADTTIAMGVQMLTCKGGML